MEIPVMTSASTHRLRSAVGVCAKPGQSYLNGSRYSGGCFEKIIDHDSGRNDCKRSKNAHYRTCPFDHKGRSGKLRNAERFAEDASKKYRNGNGLNASDRFFAAKFLGENSLRKNAGRGFGKSSSVAEDDNNNNDNASKKGGVPENCELIRDTGKKEDNLLKWQPKHTMTRRSSRIFREVIKSWKAVAGTTQYASADDIKLMCENLRSKVPKVQAQRVLERVTRENRNRISFEDYCCTFANEQMILSGNREPTTSSLGRDGSEQDRMGRNRKASKTMRKYEVFLGGSCNPTTWRTEIAIPDLNKMGISYFNPQVSQWKPELLEAEYHAKESAAVMFFVIDNQTRGVSAQIEVAHLAGSKRNLILAIQPCAGERQMICGERISHEECEDLKRGLEVLEYLVLSQGVPVFDSITLALQCTQKVLREKVTVHELDKKPFHSGRTGKSMEKQMKPREAFDALPFTKGGELALADFCPNLKLLSKKEISANLEKEVAECSDGRDGSLVNKKMSCQPFCPLLERMEKSEENKDSFRGDGKRILRDFVMSSRSFNKDVYLGGTCLGANWKEELAIPLLEKSGLSYFSGKVRCWDKETLPAEMAAINSSYILLMVITNADRSVSEMIAAGHFIGVRKRMVLCVENFSEGAVVGSNTLSENAIKDYNRGRVYLLDIAKRNGVPVFGNVSDALDRVIRECEQR